MATLVRVRATGSARGDATIYDSTTASGVATSPGLSSTDAGVSPASVRGFRIKSAIGRHYKQNSTATAAALVSGTVSFTAAYPGAYGNGIQFNLATGSYPALSITVTNVSGTANPVVNVFAPTGTAAITVVNALNAHAMAGQLGTYAVGGGTSAGAVATNGSSVYAVGPVSLAGGSNGTGTQDAEPGPQTLGLNGEPIFFNVTNQTTWVVDQDDSSVGRTFSRNYWRINVLGPA